MTAKKIKMIATFALVGILVIIGLTGIYVVKEGEQAVVLTFGRITETKEAGFYWHIPMVQSVRVQSTEAIYTMEYGFRTKQAATTMSQAVYDFNDAEAMILTGDQNILRVEAVYQVVVKDVAMFYYKVSNPFQTMQCSFESVLRRNLQSKTLDDALLQKETIDTEVLKDFQEMLQPYDLGVTVLQVKIQNITVPEQVKAAYEDVINAKNEKTRRLDEAEKYKNEVLPKARAQAYKLENDAQAYKAKTVASAEGEVAEFNSVLEKYIGNREITRTRLLIETMESILAKAAHIYMMDDDSGVLKMLTLNETAPRETPQATAAPQAAAEGGN